MYLVTGASGFMGRHLLALLDPLAAAQGQTIYALCRDVAAWRQMSWTGALRAVTPVAGDVTRADAWQARFVVPRGRPPALLGIFHLAAVVHHSRTRHEAASYANVEGARQMALLARTTGARLVFMSSSGTVGCSRLATAAPDESAPFCHQMVAGWPYYRSKIAAEQVCRALLPTAQALVILRPPVLLGPQDHRLRSTGTLLRQLRGKLPAALGGGMHFVDVRDVAGALLAAAQLQDPRPIYHLPGHASSLMDYFRQVDRLAGCGAPRVMLPRGLARLLARADALQGKLLRRLGRAGGHLFVDEVVAEMGSCYWGLRSAYAGHELHFVPRPADETLQDSIAWLRDEGLAPRVAARAPAQS